MTAEKKLELIRMSEIELQQVQWLWFPYIPFGKITIIQGDPGEGKTTPALRLAAACTTGTALPGMESQASFPVIYQTAEDGLGDTVKPRLMDAGADLEKVMNIVEDDRSLTLLDERIEKAIVQTEAKLMILDPIQGYLGDRVDMNRANEIRSVLKNVAAVAERTGCAIVLVGHLNKASGSSSAYRGLGSIDFRAAARSVLLVGRLKKEPHVRVMIRYWNGRKRVEYVCRSYHRGGKALCSSHRVHEEVIDRQITEQLAEQKRDWEHEQLVLPCLRRELDKKMPEIQKEIAQLRHEITENEDAMEELLLMKSMINRR